MIAERSMGTPELEAENVEGRRESMRVEAPKDPVRATEAALGYLRDTKVRL